MAKGTPREHDGPGERTRPPSLSSSLGPDAPRSGATARRTVIASLVADRIASWPLSGRWPNPANVVAIPVSVVGALLVWQATPIPFGWLVVLAAVVVMPAIGLSRAFGLARSWWVAALIGIPLALGLQLPLFIVAAWLHADPHVWGLLAVLIGAAPALIGPVRRDGEIVPIGSSRLVAICVVGLLIVATLAVFLSGRDSDDWSYAANIMDYVGDRPIAASDPVLGSDVPMIPRERLDLWLGVLGIGGRATASTVPSMLQDQLPPVLAIVAVLMTYLLGAAVGSAPRWGVVAVVALLAWVGVTASWPLQGDAFLTRLGQDKVVAWAIVSPAVLLPLLALERGWRPGRVTLFAFASLAGLGVAAVHPVTHVLLVATVGIWAALAAASRVARSDRLFVAVFGLVIGSVVAIAGLVSSGDLGPLPGTPLAQELRESALAITAAQEVFWTRLPGIVLNPNLVRDPLSISMSLLAAAVVLIRRTFATTLVAGMVITTMILAFNPLVTPFLVRFLGDNLGLGLLLRIPWILPVALALPALASAWEGRLQRALPLGPVVAVAIIIGVASSSAPTAMRSWFDRTSQAWREIPEATAAATAIAARSRLDDRALAPKALEFRLPAYDADLVLLAYRGLIGTVPHFPSDRIDEGHARADAVAAFYARDHVPYLTGDDVDTIRDFGVRFVVLEAQDSRAEDLRLSGWARAIFENAGYVVFEVEPANM